MKAYTSILSEKIPANKSRRFLFTVGAVNYAEAVVKWAHGHKAIESSPTSFSGMSVTDIEQQIEVKNPKQ